MTTPVNMYLSSCLMFALVNGNPTVVVVVVVVVVAVVVLKLPAKQ